ncbi:MAG: pyridoxal-phosphate-dependent aminotransferase family protein [Mangrovicoccus sp.]
MSLAHGRHVMAIPGPSIMPDRVLQAMHRPAPNIYTGMLHEMVDSLIPDLKAVARTSGHVGIYICNGHGVWEASLSNILAEGDKVLVLDTGRFGQGWGAVAGALGAEQQVLSFGRRAPVDPNAVEEALRGDAGQRIKAVLLVQSDTSTSVRNDVQAVRAALDAAGHPALLMVDCIACLACDRMEMDAWGVDVIVAASQKGLMTPPGLGFVFFNDRADAVRATASRVTPYWDWRPRTRPEEFYQYFFGTAPTHHIFGLREALTMLVHEEGIEAAWARHATLARAVWAACEAWSAEGPLEFNISDPDLRSHAVTTLLIGKENGTRLRNWLTEEAGVTLGIGVGMGSDEDPDADGVFRIGHMGHISPHSILGVLGSIEAGLTALDIPHGAGGVAAAAKICAQT